MKKKKKNWTEMRIKFKLTEGSDKNSVGLGINLPATTTLSECVRINHMGPTVRRAGRAAWNRGGATASRCRTNGGG